MFQFVPTVSDSVTGHHWKEPGFLVLIPPIWYLYTWVKFPIVAFSSPDWRVPGLSASPHIPVFSSSPCPLCCTRSVCPGLSCTGEPRTAPSSPYGSHQCWLVGKLISLVLLAALLQSKDIKDTHQDPQSFPAKLYYSWLAPSLYFPRLRTLNLLNFMRFLWALSPAAFLDLWMAAQCSGLSAIQYWSSVDPWGIAWITSL